MQHALVVYSMGTQPFAHDRLRHAQLIQNLSLAQILFGILISFADSTGLIFALANSDALPLTNMTSLGLLSGLVMLCTGILSARSTKQSPNSNTLRMQLALSLLNACLNFASVILFVLWSVILGAVLRSSELYEHHSDRVQLVTTGLVANVFGAVVSSAAVCCTFGTTFLYCDNVCCGGSTPNSRRPSDAYTRATNGHNWMPRSLLYKSMLSQQHSHSQLQLQLSSGSHG